MKQVHETKSLLNQSHAQATLKYSGNFAQNKQEFNSNKGHTYFAHQKVSKESCEGTEIIYAPNSPAFSTAASF